MSTDRISFATQDHDDTHRVVDTRDWAGPFRICLTCLHARTDIPVITRAGKES